MTLRQGDGGTTLVSTLPITDEALYLDGEIAWSGTGDFNVNAIPFYGASTLLTGAGSLSVDVLRIRYGVATFGGSGDLNASGELIGAPSIQASATFAGSCDLSAAARLTEDALVSLVGDGSVSVLATLRLIVVSSYLGSGDLNQDGIRFTPGSVLLVGSGGFNALARLVDVSSSVFAGVGSLSADDTLRLRAVTLLLGTGSLLAQASISGQEVVWAASAVLNGAGILSSLPAQSLASSATFIGLSDLSSLSTRMIPAVAPLRGSSSLDTLANSLQVATVTLSGSTDALVQSSQFIVAETMFVGSGEMVTESVAVTGQSNRMDIVDILKVSHAKPSTAFNRKTRSSVVVDYPHKEKVA